MIQESLHSGRSFGLGGVEAGGLVVRHRECKPLHRGRHQRWGIGVPIDSVLVEKLIKRIELQAPSLFGECSHLDLKSGPMVCCRSDLNKKPAPAPV